MSRRAKIVWIVLNVAALLLIAQAGLSARSAVDAPDARLKELQNQRLTLFREIANQMTQLRQHGAASNMDVLSANRAVLAAAVDVAESRDQRIAALEKLVSHQKQIRDILGKSENTGGTEKIQLQIQVIEAEIALERAKLGLDSK